jgi:acetate kinase
MLSQTDHRILTINTGSSSLKVALYEMIPEATRTLSGAVERIGASGGRLHLTDAGGATLIDRGGDLPDHGAALATMLAWLQRHRPELTLSAVGHRVVHGAANTVSPSGSTPK